MSTVRPVSPLLSFNQAQNDSTKSPVSPKAMLDQKKLFSFVPAKKFPSSKPTGIRGWFYTRPVVEKFAEAMSKQKSKDIAKYAKELTKKNQIDEKDTKGETPLSIALAHESLEGVRELLKNGATVSVAEGQKILQVTLNKNDYEMLYYLVKYPDTSLWLEKVLVLPDFLELLSRLITSGFCPNEAHLKIAFKALSTFDVLPLKAASLVISQKCVDQNDVRELLTLAVQKKQENIIQIILLSNVAILDTPELMQQVQDVVGETFISLCVGAQGCASKWPFNEKAKPVTSEKIGPRLNRRRDSKSQIVIECEDKSFFKVLKPRIKLGKGGTGEVFVCEHVSADGKVIKKVAGKKQILSLNMDSKQKAIYLKKKELKITDRKRAEQEKDLHLSISHPFIVQCLGYAEYSSKYGTKSMMGVELGEGSLHRVINSDWGEPSFRRETMIGLLQALKYLHSEGILHRDIKPENLFVILDEKTGKKTIKLGDFGLGVKKSKPSSILGTAGYVAPESESSEASDIFSLGVTFYEILYGHKSKKPSSAINTFLYGKEPAEGTVDHLIWQMTAAKSKDRPDTTKALDLLSKAIIL